MAQRDDPINEMIRELENLLVTIRGKAALERDESIPGGSETVLIVEPDHDVRGILYGVLERYGYTVLQAVDAPAASAVADAYDEPIALLVADPMPALDELVARLSAANPNVRVLSFSGYDGGPPPADGPVLKKPFALDEFARAIRRALDG